MPATDSKSNGTDDQILHKLGKFEMSHSNGGSSGSEGCSDDDDSNQALVNKKNLLKSLNIVHQHVVQSTNQNSQNEDNRSKYEKFLRDCFEIILQKAVFEGTERSTRITNFHAPEELESIWSQALALPKSAPASTFEELQALISDTIRYSVRVGHPYFANQLYGGLDIFGLVGGWLTDALNASVYTYEVAPAITLIEEAVLREMRQFVGWPSGCGDGIFCPGGSMANGYAISCARHKLWPEFKKKGLLSFGARLVLFTSEDAHYSVKKMAAFMGLGEENVYAIRTEHATGRMNIEHLVQRIEESLAEGATPFMVSATAGTTVIGAFDPLEKIAEVCKKYKLWMHVDAAYGGGALVSRKHRHLLNGINRADSVTWNPHKLLSAPQQCSTLLLREEGILSATHTANATYLFQKDKFYDTKYDTGDKHIQCGRRADVLKFWFMWKAKGTVGLEQHIDTAFEMAQTFTALVQKRNDFKMVIESPQCTNVCFWYIPKSLQNVDFGGNLDVYNTKLNGIAPKIKERMMREGTMMVTYQPLRERPNFFRIVFHNPNLTRSDVVYLVDEFERLAKDL